MTENRNQQSLQILEEKARNFIELLTTKKVNSSYRYEIPAYFYKEKNGNLQAVVNATDNCIITRLNATKSQLQI